MNKYCLKLSIFTLNKKESNYNFRNRKLEKQLKIKQINFRNHENN